MFCPDCGEAVDKEDICPACKGCDECCDCDLVANAATFDSDEYGEEPEDEYERRTRG